MAKNKSTTITEDKPLTIKDLTVYPDRLKYKDIKFTFDQIEHIGWYWASQYIGFINSSGARLTLWLRGHESPIEIKSDTMFVKPKIVAAYSVIAKKTFQNRLQYYTSELEDSGKFTYNGCNFFSDGKVVLDGTTFSLSKSKIEAFEINIKQGSFFSPTAEINLFIDRDIILTLIDFIMQNPQDPNVYVESQKRKKEAEEHSSFFLNNIVALMAKLSRADGHVSSEEVKIAKKFLLDTMKLNKEDFSKAISIFNDAKSSPNSFEYFAESFHSRFANDHSILSATLDLLFSIAMADGILSAEEELLLLEAEEIFGIKGKDFASYQAECRESKLSEKAYYFNVLGLSPKSSASEIRDEYRRLAMKFHPDRVHHMGTEFAKKADTKMKEINQAYEYLMGSIR